VLILQVRKPPLSFSHEKGGGYEQGEKPVVGVRPDRSLPAHSRHKSFIIGKKSMMNCSDHAPTEQPGSHTRPLSFQWQGAG